jgi:hypothetical protein
VFNDLTSIKKRNEIALGFAISYFTISNYNILLPTSDSQDYDLVIEKDNIFSKVQLKTTSQLNENGKAYKVNLRVTGGNYGHTLKLAADQSYDLLFIVTEKKDLYLIPKIDLTTSHSITLTNTYSKYKINF